MGQTKPSTREDQTPGKGSRKETRELRQTKKKKTKKRKKKKEEEKNKTEATNPEAHTSF